MTYRERRYGTGFANWCRWFWHEVIPGLVVIAFLIGVFLLSSGFWSR